MGLLFRSASSIPRWMWCFRTRWPATVEEVLTHPLQQCRHFRRGVISGLRRRQEQSAFQAHIQAAARAVRQTALDSNLLVHARRIPCQDAVGHPRDRIVPGPRAQWLRGPRTPPLAPRPACQSRPRARRFATCLTAGIDICARRWLPITKILFAFLATSILMPSGATRMTMASSLIDRMIPRMPPSRGHLVAGLDAAQHRLPLLLAFLLRADHHQVQYRDQKQGQKHGKAALASPRPVNHR